MILSAIPSRIAGVFAGSGRLRAFARWCGTLALILTCAFATAADPKVQPLVEGVQDNQDGTFTIFFGFQNTNTRTVGVPIGPTTSYVRPGADNQGQPVLFPLGRSGVWPDCAFSVVAPSSGATWYLTPSLTGGVGTGTPRTGTGGSGSPRVPIDGGTLPPNQAPVARITMPSTGSILVPGGSPVIVIVDAYDVDGAVTSVQLKDGATVLGTKAPAGKAQTSFSISGLTPGSHTLTAVVTDDTGLSVTTPVCTLIIRVAPVLTFARSGTGPLVEGGSVALTATAADADGTITKVEFSKNGTIGSTQTAPPFSWTASGLVAPVVFLSAKATDNHLLTASQSLVQMVYLPPVVSLTYPASSQIVQPQGGIITLTAAASDPDGTVANVQFLVGGTPVGQATTSPYRYQWTVPANTTSASVVATVTDATGLTASTTPVTFSINQSPAVTVTQPLPGAVVQVGAPLTVQATASDGDGPVTTMLLLKNGTPVAQASGGTLSTTLGTGAPESFTLMVQAFDTQGGISNSASIPVRINAPPSVLLTTPTSGTILNPGGTTPLTATASDSDGTVTKVEFYADLVLISADTSSPYQATWTTGSTGFHTLEARAYDNNGAITKSSVNVTVNGAPSLTWSTPANNGVITVGQAVPLLVTVSDTDGTITNVVLKEGSTTLATLTAPPYSHTLPAPSLGSHTLTAIATDNRGASTTRTVVFTVNGLATVTLTAPTAGAVVTAPGALTLRATAADADGSIGSVAFYAGTTLLGTDTTAPFEFTSSPLAAGAYALTAVATDNRGGKTTSTVVDVILNAPPTLAFTSPAASAVLGKSQPVILSATAADADGTVASVAFKNGATLLGTDTNAPFSLSTSFATEGALTLTAEATDNRGAITPTTVAVTVARAPLVTLTAPTAPAVVAPGTSVNLTATASDAGGSITSVAFLDGTTVISTDTTAPYQATWSSNVLGTHPITAVATNILGAKATTAAVVLTVSNLPQVAIIQPGDGQIYDEPATAITLTAQAVDLDNGIAQVQFLEGATVLGSATSAPFQVTLATLAQGTHVLTAKAFDSVGGTMLSAPITLRVNARPTITLTAPATGTVLTIGDTFTATVNAFDREGIAQVNLLAGTSIIAQATRAPWTLAPVAGGSAGAVTLTAQVVDNDGLAAVSAPVQVTYNTRPTCTIALATPGAPYDPASGMGLVATAADSDGTIAKVTFYDGETVIGEDASAPYQLQWFGASPTPHVLTAIATDNRGAPGRSGTLTVTVNALPVAFLTAPTNGAVFQAPATITLTATASDSDGTIASVVFKNGATLLATDTAAPFSHALTNLASGSYTVTATATDNSGGVRVSSPVTFTVAGGPSVALTAPTANAVLTAGASVPLAATASVSGGTISLVKFYDGANLLGQDATAPFTSSWIANGSGTHTLTAQAISDSGLSATSLPVSVTVNAPPVVTVSGAWTSPNMVLSATATDSDGSITQVRFLANGTALNTDTSSPYSYSWLNPAVGVYDVVAEATDNRGAVLASTTLKVTINAQASIPPTVSLTTPSAGARFALGAAIPMTATAAPGTSGGVPVGTVARVEFYDGATKIGEDLTSPYAFTWNGATSGRHGIAAVAFSNGGSSTVSTQAIIIVNAPPTVALTAPGADSVVTAGAALTLTATAADSDGTIASVAFLDGATVLGTTSSVPYQLLLPTGLAAGSRSLSVRATDDLGGVTTSAAVPVISNQAPVIALSAPTAGVKPNNTDVALAATVTDADGTIASVQFLANGQPIGAADTTSPYQATFVQPPSGNYALTARATDNRGTVGVSPSIAIQVDAAPSVAITSPAGGTRVVTGSSVSISALAGDVDGTVTSVRFLVDGTTLSTSSAFPFTATWTATSGVHSLTAIATDDLGRTTTSAAVSVTGNAPPAVAITAPAANTSVAGGVAITLTATASDDGSIANVAFFDGSARLAVITASPYTWTWNGASPRTHDLTAVATDNFGAITTSTPVAITVTDSNQAPTVALTKPSAASVVYAGDSVALAATASDADGVITLVDWTIDGAVVASDQTPPYAATGTMPTATGTHVVQARATDERGRRTLSTALTVTAKPLSSKPQIALTFPLAGDVVKITDGIWFAATATVSGSTISKVDFLGNGTAVASDTTSPYSASWSPLAVGPVTVSATATDATGGQASTPPISVMVISADLQVIITNPPSNGIVQTNAPTIISAQVVNGYTISKVEFFVGGVLLATDTSAPYQATWTPTAVADVVLTAKVYDYNQTKTSAPVNVQVRTDNGIGPTVAFSKPVADYGILGTEGVVGSVTSGSPAAQVAGWTLTMAPVGSGDYREIATGTTGTVTATIDTSRLINGPYLLVLTGTDTLGRSKVAMRKFLVEDQYKPGQFSFTVQDLVTPVSGIPLAVNRTYNSLNRDRVGDFGYGWSASFTDLEIKHDEQRIDAYDLSFNIVNVRNGAGGRDVTVTLPDGNRATFQFDLAPGANFHNQAFFRSPASTTATLGVYPNSAGDLITLLPPAKPYWAGTYGWTDSPWELYDFPGYILILEDGTQYFFKREDLGDRTVAIGSAYAHHHYYGNTYLDRIVQPDGNQILVDQNGIRHQDPSGQPTRRIVYQRDGQNRITAVFDSLAQDANGNPSGLATVKYAYNTAGDLVSVKQVVDRTKPEAQAYETSQYFYEDARFPHYLTRIVDPSGQPALRCEYDANGRLVATVDAAGNRVAVQNDLAARTTTVIDRNGKPTVLGHDAQGRILRSTDALGNTSHKTYDGRGALLTETDPLGHTTTYTNDALGHRLSETDALGNVARWTYDAKGNVLTATDKNGHVTTNEYNAQGNLTKTTDALLKSTTYAYGANNKLVSETDALGRITGYGYDSSGNLTQVTDALGQITRFVYDGAGNQIRQEVTRTRADGIRETLVTQTLYDGQKRVVQVINPDGSTSGTSYSSQGKPSQVVDALGRLTSFTYTATGQLELATYPDGSSEQSTFDGEGRVLTRRDRGGRLTTYAYDAIGRLTTMLLPDGASTATAYDAAGRVTSTTDERGNRTDFAYDDVNRRTGVTNALGQSTAFEYDPVGNQTKVTDTLLRATRFAYDAVDRRTTTTYPNASTTVTGYDAVGQRISEQDQAGKLTTFAYDAVGRLVSVTDALGKVTGYGYDEVGNQVAQVDALGRTTRYGYDGMGRRLTRKLPAGQQESMIYNAVGSVLSATDFRGYTTTFTYDAGNRPLTKTVDTRLAQPVVTWTYTVDGRRSTMVDAHGTTTYHYDGRGRLQDQVTPRGTVFYAYDARGNLARLWTSHTGGADTRYGYDALNRLATVTDSVAGEVSYGYDPVGNQATVALPNGVTSTYGFDTVNRLLSVTRKLGAATQATHTYTLDAVGRRTRVVETGTVARTANWAYDVLSRLTSEAITGTAPTGTVEYEFDHVGNRQVRTSTLAGVGSTVNGYTANDWLTTDTYDANGNTVTSSLGTDVYDAENRITRRTIPVTAATVLIGYDGDGNKVSEIAGGVTTTFLVSALNPTGYAQTLEELQTSGISRVYVWGNGLAPLAQRGASGPAIYPVTDGQGSVRALTNAAGAVTDTYAYDAYGILVGRTGTTANRYLYCGYEFCEPLGQYYLRARLYDQGRGRFATFDGYEGDKEDPSQLHKYAYCAGSPLDFSDPSGHMFTIAELSAVQTMMTGLRNISTISYHGAMRLIRRKAFSVYFCVGRGIGSRSARGRLGNAAAEAIGHAFIFVKVMGMASGVYMDANPDGNSSGALRGEETDGVIGGRRMSMSAAKAIGNTYFKEVTKLSTLGYTFWRMAIKSMPTTDDLILEGDQSVFTNTSRRYSLNSIPYFSGTINCYSWSLEAAGLAWIFGRM